MDAVRLCVELETGRTRPDDENAEPTKVLALRIAEDNTVAQGALDAWSSKSYVLREELRAFQADLRRWRVTLWLDMRRVRTDDNVADCPTRPDKFEPVRAGSTTLQCEPGKSRTQATLAVVQP